MDGISPNKRRKIGRKQYLTDSSKTVPRTTAWRWKKLKANENPVGSSSCNFTPFNFKEHSSSSEKRCQIQEVKAGDQAEDITPSDEDVPVGICNNTNSDVSDIDGLNVEEIDFAEYDDGDDSDGDEIEPPELLARDLQIVDDTETDILERESDNESADDDDRPTQVADNRPLYEGADVTNSQMQVLLMKYVWKHNVTGEQLEDLCKIFEILHPAAVPSSKYLLKKTLSPHLTYEFHFYCENCKRPVQDDCEECASCHYSFSLSEAKKKEHYFITFPVKKQLQDLLENHQPKLLKKSDVLSDPDYSDVLSGDVIRDLFRKGKIRDDDFTMLWSLDGAQAFKNSSVSYWPLLTTINELSMSDRKRNMLLLGLWFGSEKPVMDTFLLPIVEEFKSLGTRGLRWKDSAGVDICSRAYLNLCTCDAVAQPLIRNCHQFNGQYGCPKCYHPGERTAKGDGFVRIYKFVNEKERLPGMLNAVHAADELRTVDSHLVDCQEAVRRKEVVHGVKGPSPLMFLPLFSMLNFCGEYMHGVMLGVMRQLFSLWFDSTNHEHEWYMGRRVHALDRLFLSIKPPKEITRAPSSISCRKYWKASEFRSFLLYYGPIILKDHLPKQFYNHFMLLSGAMYLLLLDRITGDQIDVAELALKKFLIYTQCLYGVEHLSYNQHQLLHLADSVRKWGPLWSNSAFRFEGMNHNILKMKHGTQHTARQIADAYVCQRSLEVTANDCMVNASSSVKVLFRKLSNNGAYLPSNPTKIGNLQLYGRLMYTCLSMSENIAILRLTGIAIPPAEKVRSYMRFSTKDFVCHSEDYRNGNLRRRNNDMIETTDGSLFSVVKLVIVGPSCHCDDACNCEQVIILLRKYAPCFPQRPLIVDAHLNRLGFKFQHFKRVSRTDEIVACHPNHLAKKCIRIEVDNEYFVVPIVNSKETD